LAAAEDIPHEQKTRASLLELPCFRIHGAKLGMHLTLEPAPGLTIKPSTLGNLEVEGRPSPSEMRYRASKSDYRGAFEVRQSSPPRVTVQTTASANGKEVAFTSTIDYRAPGEIRTIGLKLSDWEGEVQVTSLSTAQAALQEGNIVRWREQFRRTDGRCERSWSLDLAGVRDHYRLVLRGRIPLEEAGEGVSVPRFDAKPSGSIDKHTLVVDDSLGMESSVGLSRAALPSGSPAGAKAWTLTGEEWCSRLLPREGPGSAPVQILLAEQRLSMPDGRRWLHEADFWLSHDSPTELRLSWPKAVELAGVLIDDNPVSVPRQDQTQLWLPLSGPGGVRHVQILWRKEADEPLASPDLSMPRLAGQAELRGSSTPTIWTVDVPPGWEAVTRDGLESALDGRAALALQRAAAQLAISRALLRQLLPDDQVLRFAQRRFARQCWLARLALVGGTKRQPRIISDEERTGLSAAEWLEHLEQHNKSLLLEHQREEILEEADRHKRDPESSVGSNRRSVIDSGPRRGKISFLSALDSPAPLVRLAPVSRHQFRQALLFSVQWLVLMLLVWLVTLSAFLRAAMRRLWPELMAGLGLLGWQAAGPTVVVLFVLALGIAGRLLLLTRGIRTLLSRPPRPSSVRG
jgi:hypothetical protein